ncbi:enoyl-CoA hydratase/isomerase family protein [Variovorax paradoxus]|nr:enoyl-CoA hydratase/isomerase family protein [Variovorax paradoxus]MBT2304818.1 enoyl-CoA hydratase/isomerase family protein [Variovorax paradoxus]
MNYAALEIEQAGPATWIWMNKPEVHNAFDEQLIAELTELIGALDVQPQVRVIVLGGRGKSFSAGANLNWMRRQGAASAQANLADARKLANLFKSLSECATPTVARVHGPALGGGMGLASACDICIASERASFATSEVKFGIIPAAISPYVLRAIGERQAYRYFQTAERIDAATAKDLGLAHEVVAAESLDEMVQKIVEALLAGGPLSQHAATGLIRAVANRPVSAEIVEDTARRIATLRSTPEAKEGLAAFLEKRPANWLRS